MAASRGKFLLVVSATALVAMLLLSTTPLGARAQRDDDASDDFDDSGFDNSGYGQPNAGADANREAEGSNQQPAQSSSDADDAADDDDDIDESRVDVSLQRAPFATPAAAAAASSYAPPLAMYSAAASRRDGLR